MWIAIVAYMVGMHNFYNGDSKTIDKMVDTEISPLQENGRGYDRFVERY